jgi:protein-S-isoprenylcysteine O-methyltransferase Ste14
MATEKKLIERIRTKFTRVLGIIMFACLAFCESKWAVASPVTAELLTGLGLIFVSIAACGRLWCMLYIAGYKTQKLVTAGPYSLCRNPLYIFSFIGTVGIGLGSATFTIPLVFIAAFFLYYPLTIKKEEDRLLEIHGEAFRNYCEKTPRYFPSVKNFHEPEQYKVDPRIFRRHVGNAILWVCFFGLWNLFECLRVGKWIPTLFSIW